MAARRERKKNSLNYEGSEKHKHPWQRGRRGSLCPTELGKIAQRLLDSSVPDGKQRFAVHEGQAYRALAHGPNRWHGHPVGWKEVPEQVRRRWLKDGKVSRAEIRLHWDA